MAHAKQVAAIEPAEARLTARKVPVQCSHHAIAPFGGFEFAADSVSSRQGLTGCLLQGAY